MTYAHFLLIFLCVPLVVLTRSLHLTVSRRPFIMLGVLSLVALLYTAPWDNFLIAKGVWSFHRSKVLGIVIGRVPLEEYIFYILQVFVTGLWTIWLLRQTRTRWDEPDV